MAFTVEIGPSQAAFRRRRSKHHRFLISYHHRDQQIAPQTPLTMTLTRPHIVVAMGSYQVSYHWRLFRSAMGNSGYDVTIVTLRSTIMTGSIPVPDAMSNDVAAIREVVSEQLEAGYNVVVLAHSAGGVAASGALEGSWYSWVKARCTPRRTPGSRATQAGRQLGWQRKWQAGTVARSSSMSTHSCWYSAGPLKGRRRMASR